MLVYLRYNFVLVHYLSAVEDKKKLIMLVILHLQLIINQVQIEISPDLLEEEENEMVRLNLKLFFTLSN